MEYGPGRLTEERGQLTSPNYPFSYYSNAECRWQISAPGTYEVCTVYLRAYLLFWDC
jgi:CUB domain